MVKVRNISKQLEEMLGDSPWESRQLELKARLFATKWHSGQVRKGNGKPYITHPIQVAEYLKEFGVDDPEQIAIALLHDTIEDTPVTFEDIKYSFGEEIAAGVNWLTKSNGYQAYKQQLEKAPDNIKLIKLCDVLHNTSSLEALSRKSIARSLRDCKEFYIPMAESLNHEIAERIEENIEGYLATEGLQEPAYDDSPVL